MITLKKRKRSYRLKMNPKKMINPQKIIQKKWLQKNLMDSGLEKTPND